MSTTGNNNARAGLSFATFASRQQQSTQGNSNTSEKEEPAEFWMNIGYPARLPDEDGEMTTTFVSLARGIPIDQLKPYDVTKERTENMAILRDAQNDLAANLLAAAQTLEPGESRIILGDESVGLFIELKRRKAPIAAPTTNGLKRTFNFGGLTAPEAE
jgi:hypothetical protein